MGGAVYTNYIYLFISFLLGFLTKYWGLFIFFFYFFGLMFFFILFSL